jgi:hypothetical protein
MANFEYRVYLSRNTSGSRREWFNRFVYRSDVAVDGVQGKEFCRALLTAVRSITTARAVIEGVGIFPYPTAASSLADTTPYYWHGGHRLDAGARPSGIETEDSTALKLYKQADYGFAGRAWFFDTLNADDIELNPDGQYTLINVAEFQQLIQFFFIGGLEAVTEFQLILPRSPPGIVKYVAERAASFRLGYPIRAAVREKYLASIEGQQFEIFDAVKTAASNGNYIVETLDGWIGNGLDFTPTQLRLDVLNYIEQTYRAAQKVKKLTDYDKDDGQSGVQLLFNRWGQNVQAVAGLASTTEARRQADIEALGQMRPYTFVDREDYFTHDQAIQLRDFATYWANAATVLLDFDYLTPFTTNADGEPVTADDAR